MSKLLNEVALLVANKNDSFVKFLSTYFNEKKVHVRIFDGRNELYLYLLTNKPTSILVSRQISSNQHIEITKWIKHKYKITTILFDEKDGLELKANERQVEARQGVALNNSADFDHSQSIGKENIHLTTCEDLVDKIDVNKKIAEQKESKSKLDKLVKLKLELSKIRSSESVNKTQLVPVNVKDYSGYIIVESDEEVLAEEVIDKLELKNTQVLHSSAKYQQQIKKEFIGAYKNKNNIYSFDCHMPEFNIIEQNDMLEVDIKYFTSYNPVEFDIYLYMENSKSNYHYLSSGGIFSQEQINKLKQRRKKVRVELKNKMKLLSHLNINHMVRVSEEL